MDSFDKKCPECSKTFCIDIHREVTYTTSKNCNINSKQHKWSAWEPLDPEKDNYLVRECSECEELEFKDEV